MRANQNTRRQKKRQPSRLPKKLRLKRRAKESTTPRVVELGNLEEVEMQSQKEETTKNQTILNSSNIMQETDC